MLCINNINLNNIQSNFVLQIHKNINITFE